MQQTLDAHFDAGWIDDALACIPTLHGEITIEHIEARVGHPLRPNTTGWMMKPLKPWPSIPAKSPSVIIFVIIE